MTMKRLFACVLLIVAGQMSSTAWAESYQGVSGYSGAEKAPQAPVPPVAPEVATPAPVETLTPVQAPAMVDPCAAYMSSYQAYVVCHDRMQKIQRLKDAQKSRDAKLNPPPSIQKKSPPPASPKPAPTSRY